MEGLHGPQFAVKAASPPTLADRIEGILRELLPREAPVETVHHITVLKVYEHGCAYMPVQWWD